MTRPPSATGDPEAPRSVAERDRMRAYLSARAAALAAAQIRARVRAAAAELEAALDAIAEVEARRPPAPGEWSIAQVVDHVAQTTIRGADELRHLLAGRRPPAPPVYEALTSGAAAWAPWAELIEGLRSANAEFDAVLAMAPGGDPPAGGPTAQAILVVNERLPGGGVRAETFTAELGWKEYALVQRLHLLDHRSQVRALRAALGPAERSAAP